MGMPRHHARPIFKQSPPAKPTYIDPELFKKSVTATSTNPNHLITFLNGVFGVAMVKQMIADKQFPFIDERIEALFTRFLDENKPLPDRKF